MYTKHIHGCCDIACLVCPPLIAKPKFASDIVLSRKRLQQRWFLFKTTTFMTVYVAINDFLLFREYAGKIRSHSNKFM